MIYLKVTLSDESDVFHRECKESRDELYMNHWRNSCNSDVCMHDDPVESVIRYVHYLEKKTKWYLLDLNRNEPTAGAHTSPIFRAKEQ